MTNTFSTKKTQKKLLGSLIILLSLIGIVDVSGYVGGILSYCFVFLCGDFFILPFFMIMLLTIPLFRGEKVKINFAYVGLFLTVITLLTIFSKGDLPISITIDNYMESFKSVTPPLFTNLFKGYLNGGFIGVTLYALLANLIGPIMTNLIIYLVLIFALIVAVKPFIFNFVNHFYTMKNAKKEEKKEEHNEELKEFKFVEPTEPSVTYSGEQGYNREQTSYEPQTSYKPQISITDYNSEQSSEPSVTLSEGNAHLIEDLSFGASSKPTTPTINEEPKSSSFSIFEDDLGFDEGEKTSSYHEEPSSLNEEPRPTTSEEPYDPNKIPHVEVTTLTSEEPIKVQTIRNDGEKPFNYSEGYSDYTDQDARTPNSMRIFKRNEEEVPVSRINDEVTPSVETPIKEEPSVTPVKEEVIPPTVQEQHIDEEEDREPAKVEVAPVVHETPKVVHSNRPYKLPPISLLNDPTNTDNSKNKLEADIKRVLLNDKLKSLNIKAEVHDIIVAPSFTRFEIEVASDVKLSAFNSIKQDIMMALSAEKINILTPIPGTSFVGIEIPNVTRSAVSFKEVLKDILYPTTQPLLTAVGKDITGETVKIKINKAPHLLIAGTTGSGKSVCINTIIATLLMRTSYKDVRMILIDPKKVEMAVYAGIPHLLCPVINDPLKATVALKRVCDMMDERYQLFADISNDGPVCREIERYNQIMEERGEEKLPYVVVVIDELSDLMMLASKDVEDSIRRITQLARSAGIHLIVATQRPSVDVITGVIKANIPSRIAFATSNNADSRTILDCGGAEDLLGKGDSLVHMAGDMKMSRVQGAYVSDEEIERICDYVKQQRSPIYDPRFQNLEPPQTEANFAIEGISAADDDDEIYNQILDLLKTQTHISTSFLQRRFSMGFPKAGRMIDRLEQDGFISPSRGSKPREVYQDKL